ncbi:MAG: hypothetical protein PGN16_09220 [Sphingomonas phyllosphaerae]
MFDHIVEEAKRDDTHTSPWIAEGEGKVRYVPDYRVLEQLLGVPLHLRAGTQSGVPALALDVWLSYELRRAGFDEDQVWPRPKHPRILPSSVAKLIKTLPKELREGVTKRVNSAGAIPGVTMASASILGKNYFKQVDVIMTGWDTGPELLISTKRMDSSYGKNAPNRIEESYGDAKNLRLRHPLAALGFAFALRSDILHKEPRAANWLFDLLAKLGQEDDAYHATCVILMKYDDAVAPPDTRPEEPSGMPALNDEADLDAVPAASMANDTAEAIVAGLPKVTVLTDQTPPNLCPGRFLEAMVRRVLAATPVNVHEAARERLREAGQPAAAHEMPPEAP